MLVNKQISMWTEYSDLEKYYDTWIQNTIFNDHAENWTTKHEKHIDVKGENKNNLKMAKDIL